jgi:hypothetical protein
MPSQFLYLCEYCDLYAARALDNFTWVEHQLISKSYCFQKEQQILFFKFYENLVNPLCSKVMYVGVLSHPG